MEKIKSIKKKELKKKIGLKESQKHFVEKKEKPKVIVNDERGKISDSGFWIIEDEKANKEHAFDPNLAVSIKNLIKKIGYNENDLLYDLGCGKGDYVKYFNSEKIKAIGFDGNPNTKKFCKECEVHDLTKPLNRIPVKFVMSLEVAEHIPKDKEYLYIKTLNDAVAENGYLILSWAYPGQGGFGHFNELDNSYCKKLFMKLGYENLEEYEKYLRYRAKLKWFKYTIMVFQKKKIIEMTDIKMKDLYFTINEESEENIKKIKELKKVEGLINFSNKKIDWDKKLLDKKFDLNFEDKQKLLLLFENIFFNSEININEPIEIFNTEIKTNDLPSINSLNILEILNSKKYNKIKLSIIKNIINKQDEFILSFPKEFREFIYTRKLLFLRNTILLALLWYIIFFSDYKENNIRNNYYDLYKDMYKNKYKFSIDILNKMDNMEGYYIFFKNTLCESYMSRRNTHIYFLILSYEKLIDEYIKHNEFDIIKNIKEPVYTKLFIDFKAYGINDETKMKDEKNMNKFFMRVKNLINDKNLEIIDKNLV